MRKALLRSLIVSLLSLIPTSALCQEQYISACAQRPACVLDTGVSWGAPTRTYVFTPVSPSVALRIWIHNNNPTSGHTAQTIKCAATDSTLVTSVVNQADQWTPCAITDGSAIGAQCTNVAANNSSGSIGTGNGKASCLTAGIFAAQIAIQFTPGGAQAGSPDTFDIGIVQQPNAAIGGPQVGQNPFFGGGVNAAGTSYYTQNILTNPGASVMVLGVINNNTTKTFYFNRVVITCSATCTPILNTTFGGVGATCTASTVNATKFGSTVASSSTSEFNCTTNPTFQTQVLPSTSLAASTPFVFDLSGMVAPAGSTWGMAVQNPAALTGTMAVTFFWTEQ